MFKKIGLVLVTISICSHYAFSQIKSFSQDPEKWLAEITAFCTDLDKADEKKAVREFMEYFAMDWSSGKFSEAQQKQVYNVTNQMLKRKMRVMPNFIDYLTCLQLFVNSDQTEASFNAWHGAFDKLIARSSQKLFLEYLAATKDLLGNNIIYGSGSTVWQASSDDFHFELEEEKPKVIFQITDLYCYAKNDSAAIYETSGTYYPLDQEWRGKGGNVYWERAGLERDLVYAQLSNYSLKTSYARYSADSVVFYNKQFLKNPLLGHLNEKVIADVTEERANYPQFESYNKRIRINNIFEDVDYEGGFSMHGSKLLGSGGKGIDALLFFKREGKLFVKASSKAFLMRTDRISSSFAAVSIYWKEDSIYHPGLEMKYEDKDRELSLFRGMEGISSGPFYNTFHKLDMYCEALTWKMGQPKIDFKMVNGPGYISDAFFESANFYTVGRYLRLQGLEDVNPLIVIRNFYRKYNRRDFYLEEMVSFMRKAPEQVKILLMTLSISGFLIYDLEDDYIIIKDRLFEYLNAYNGKTDYDVIRFMSSVSGQSNASLNLLNFDLRLFGVPLVQLSDSQNVYIYPSEQQIIMKENRDFVFDGRIKAGMLDLFAKQCYFEYDKFRIDLPDVDSLVFRVYSFEADKYGKRRLVKVKTPIEDIGGEILIDHSNNKSGLKDFPQYPVFNSVKSSFIYYDKPQVCDGVYKRDKFYYKVLPFSMDSLDNFSTEGIEFEGYLVSADIFPVIEKPLTVMPDYSLGIMHSTSASGYPVYRGAGRYVNDINLSYEGLRGSGTLNYLISTAVSEQFVFFPDSTNADLKTYEIREQITDVQFPDVKAEDVYMYWRPYADLMLTRSKKNPFEMYQRQSQLNGHLALSSKGLTGGGKIEFEQAEMIAKLYKFKNQVFDSDTADFKLKVYTPDIKFSTGITSDYAFETHNYRSHIDFENRKGNFISNGGLSRVNFPINLYICSIDEFGWYMDKEEIELAQSAGKLPANIDQLSLAELVDIDLSGLEFISTHLIQDSLRFFAQKARYNLKDNIIYAEGVRFIKVADAAVFPEKGDITILKKAEMLPIEKCSILANTTSKLHAFSDATVNIIGRQSYYGSGMSYYIDETNAKQPIYFDEIIVDNSGQTVATGKVTEDVNFSLSPEFSFIGEVTLTASQKFLSFNGGARIKHDCDTVLKSWLKFNAVINPKEIFIPVLIDAYNTTYGKLGTSISITTDTVDVYSAFLTPKYRPGDKDIIKADGYLTYDKNSKEYRIAKKEKLQQLSLPDNYLSLGKSSCILYGEGNISMGCDYGRVHMDNIGSVKYYMIPDSCYLDMLTGFNFYFSNDALKLMDETIENNLGLEGISLGGEKFTKAMMLLLGEEQADKVMSDINLYGYMRRVPKELNYMILFSDISMKWNKRTRSFTSVGDLGIGMIGETQINKYVKGKIEIKHKRGGDILHIYLEPSEKEWFYFFYQRGQMLAVSSDEQFNTLIREVKPDDKRLKAEKGKEPYIFNLTSPVKKKSFVRRFKDELTNDND